MVPVSHEQEDHGSGAVASVGSGGVVSSAAGGHAPVSKRRTQEQVCVTVYRTPASQRPPELGPAQSTCPAPCSTCHPPFWASSPLGDAPAPRPLPGQDPPGTAGLRWLARPQCSGWLLLGKQQLCEPGHGQGHQPRCGDQQPQPGMGAPVHGSGPHVSISPEQRGRPSGRVPWLRQAPPS